MATVSEVSICNMALTELKATPITSLTDPDSDRAVLSALWYPITRDAVLEDSDWTFAIKRMTLTPLVAAPNWGYGKQFTLPGDILRLISVSDNATDENNIDWRKEDNVVVCDSDTIYIRYVARIEDPIKFSPSFVMCLAARLASHLAIPVAGSRTLQQDKWQLYEMRLNEADGNDGRQGMSDRIGTKSNIIRRR